jgi:hypothetical protein
MRKYNQSNDLNRPIVLIILATCATPMPISSCGNDPILAASIAMCALLETNSAFGSRMINLMAGRGC